MVVSEERMAALEARTARLEARMTRLDAVRAAAEPAGRRVEARPDALLEARPQAPLKAPAPASLGARPQRPLEAPAMAPLDAAAMAPSFEAPPASSIDAGFQAAGRGRAAASAPRLEDLLGGRVLGWVGGLAVLVGLLFFLVIAASRGWIGEEARVLMAAGASFALLAAGAWLHERRGRNEAALAATATGIAGLFATVVVAGPVYDLLPALPALAVALAVGATATGLAVRWEAPGIGWLGILGALLAPTLVGAGDDDSAIAFMLVAYGAAGAVMVWQRWHALAGVAFAVAVPQLGWWLLDGPSAAGVVAALSVFGAVTAVAAAGFEWRMRAPQVRVSALVLLALDALALAGLGSLGLDDGGTSLWLAALALVHLAAGLLARRSSRVSRELTLMLAGLGIVLADVAFASVADGLPLVLGWAAGAVGFSALARAARHRADEAVALGGLSGHLLLAVATAVTGAAPVSAMSGAAPDQAAAIAALAALVAAAWAAARLVEPRRPEWRLALDAAALCALLSLSAVALDGVALTLALAGEAAALAALAGRLSNAAGDATGAPPRPGRRERLGAGPDPLPFPAAVVFLGVALTQALAVLAPPSVLVAGLDPVLAAVAGLAAIAGAAVLVARAAPTGTAALVARAAPTGTRVALGATAAAVALYLVSALVVTPFQPGGDASGLPLAQLDVRQQGQALLSALWALAGVAALIAGLVRDTRTLRLGALALLTLTVGKVFAFDLASLTSLYRVGSCIALGLLLLLGAYAWQRIRPRPLPDLRGVPGALR
ncbi:MAG TPA: DUF2339 domain-containing protein [Solirubrobacteraceae bacterium]|nr:DUF2339 domain-containing protein [Solirubrobacteraceae bacterium]